jgi:isoleucyl-tRNA synthetase
MIKFPCQHSLFNLTDKFSGKSFEYFECQSIATGAQQEHFAATLAVFVTDDRGTRVFHRTQFGELCFKELFAVYFATLAVFVTDDVIAIEV